jgi:ABC-type transport system involved in cytochrome c biogenesis permease component
MTAFSDGVRRGVVLGHLTALPVAIPVLVIAHAWVLAALLTCSLVLAVYIWRRDFSGGRR